MPPFCAIPLRGRKDALRARYFARQFAHLLRFPASEQTCIAAGAFLIACQVLQRKLKAKLLFRIEGHHFQVVAEPEVAENSPHGKETEGVFRLSKLLPENQGIEEKDLHWMVQTTQTSGWLFEEICRQNQEILTLLHELQATQVRTPEGKSPHAA